MAHVRVGVYEELERTRLAQERKEGHAGRDLADNSLDLALYLLRRLPRRLGCVAVTASQTSGQAAAGIGEQRWKRSFTFTSSA